MDTFEEDYNIRIRELKERMRQYQKESIIKIEKYQEDQIVRLAELYYRPRETPLPPDLIFSIISDIVNHV